MLCTLFPLQLPGTNYCRFMKMYDNREQRLVVLCFARLLGSDNDGLREARSVWFL